MTTAHAHGLESEDATAANADGTRARVTDSATAIRLTVAGLTLTAGALYGWGLSRGATHYYYSAAVRSMSENWHAFFFGSLDPAGSLTVDKLPGGLWVQALFVRVLGFHTWTLLLPEALAATATVPLLFATVRRWRGPRAGVVAAVVFMLSPITYVTARVNIADTLMVLCLVGAAYALMRALDDGSSVGRSRGWLLVAGALIGVGFQMKMLEAWLPLPALALAYLVGARLPMRTRLFGVALFGAVGAAVSLSWMTVVSLVPASGRPYIDGSATDSVWSMVFDYNGLGRGVGGAAAPAVPYGGEPGPGRLFNAQLGGQISWLLPLALVALAAGCRLAVRRRDRCATSGWLLWGGWLVVCGTVFSAGHGIHPYYVVLLSPAVAALVGAGAHEVLLGARAARWLLAITVAITGAWACVVIAHVGHGQGWLVPLIVSAVIALLVLTAVSRVSRVSRSRSVALGCAGIAILAGPATWIAITPPAPAESMHTTNPVAGPQIAEVVFGNQDTAIVLSRILGIPPGGPPFPADAPLPGTSEDPALLDYVIKHHHGERYLFATGDASSAAPYIAAGYSVLPMGGFTSATPFPVGRDLDAFTRSGHLRYVLLTAISGLPGAMGQRAGWAAAHCIAVAPDQIYGSSAQAQPGAPTLFDCRGPGNATTPKPVPSDTLSSSAVTH